MVCNFRDLLIALNVLFMWKVSFKKKCGTSHWVIFVSSTTQKFNIFLQDFIIQFPLCYPSQVVAYRRLKTKESFIFLALYRNGHSCLLEVVAYKRFQI